MTDEQWTTIRAGIEQVQALLTAFVVFADFSMTERERYVELAREILADLLKLDVG